MNQFQIYIFFFFFFNDTATTEIYTLSLHDALPISWSTFVTSASRLIAAFSALRTIGEEKGAFDRSEEHTSELQSQSNLVCRLLLEKKKKQLESHSASRHNHYSYCTHVFRDRPATPS